MTSTLQSQTWRVYQNNRFVGYVLAWAEREAVFRAKERYGIYVRVERVSTFF